MCFHCSSERLVLVGCHCPRTGMGPTLPCAHGCSQHITAPCWCCSCQPFGELPDRAAPLGHPPVWQPISGPVSSGSALPLLISALCMVSSHLMLGWCQVRLQEGEDGWVAAQGLQCSLRTCPSPPGPQGWVHMILPCAP